MREIVIGSESSLKIKRVQMCSSVLYFEMIFQAQETDAAHSCAEVFDSNVYDFTLVKFADMGHFLQ